MSIEQSVKVQFVGCGDAFGTGGRFNTCFRVEHPQGSFLMDCGASSMIALRQAGIDPNSIDAIFITHLHGDHFGGLPFFILDAQLYAGRTQPLRIAGPYGLQERLEQTQEALFPGSASARRKFDIEVTELAPQEERMLWGVKVHTFPMRHPCGAPPCGLRLEVSGKSVAYTGDTQWCEGVVELANGADLLILECLHFEKDVPNHLSHADIVRHREKLGAKRIILTHFGPEMLANVSRAEFETARDGLIVEV